MPKLQEVFNRIEETKQEIKKIKSVYRDALDNSRSHKETAEEYKTIREKKKKIEEAIRTDLRSELDKLDALKQSLEMDRMLLSDLALNDLTQGKMVEIIDKYENKYEPLFSVRFKKIG